MPRETRILRSSLVGALLCALAACSSSEKPRGQLMIAVATDMSIPKNLDQVEVLVSLPDGTEQRLDYPILPSSPNPVGKPMPGTLALIPPDAGGQIVRVRLIAQQNSATGDPLSRVVREAIVKVPTDRIALLPMPLHWLCDGLLKKDTDGTFIPTCDDPDKTCLAGKCVDAHVAVESLVTYDPALVFGGGDDQGNGGTCIDVQACFGEAKLTMPADDCTLPVSSGIDQGTYNVAIELSADSDGECTEGKGSRCFLPLDHQADEGWQVSAGRVRLPPAVCERIADGKALGVAVSSACPSKDPSQPICGPWTNVTTSSTDAPPSSGGTTGGGGGGGNVSAGTGGSGASGPDTTPTACGSDGSCPTGAVCVYGLCAVPCMNDANCGPSTACLRISDGLAACAHLDCSTCISALNACSTSEGLCRNKCSADANCLSGQTCSSDGLCRDTK